MISAISNMIGMYYNRPSLKAGIDYPDIPEWPKGYVPIAVHTVDDETDHIGNPDAICKRQKWLLKQIRQTPEYKKLLSDNQDLLATLTQKCGMHVDFENLWKIRDVLFIEKVHNKERNIDDEMFERIDDVNSHVENYENGLNLSKYNGINFRVEMPKIRGGNILWAMLDHVDLKIHCQEPKYAKKRYCNWANKIKYYAYSAHDTTVAALMATWGAKLKVIPLGYPLYSAAIILELWKTSDGYKIQVIASTVSICSTVSC
ncbi:hypothetical protein AB6A40_008133 [Gnathostoma spinigerum]|uniref:acid phosphatase n=1 Tax=Gnathostoma spinigerum TaxID=75299 RepID=A0ABD6EVZ0_9BILA